MGQTDQVVYNRAKVWQIAFFTLNNIATNAGLMMMGYYAFYTQNVLGLGAVVIGLIGTLTRVFDGITDPIAGILIDKTNGKFGKYRPFMLIGNIILCVCMILIFRTPTSFSTQAKYIYVTVLYVIYIVGYTLQTISTKAAQVILTNDPKQRPLFSGFNSVFNQLLGMFIPVLITSILSDRYSVGQYAATAERAGTGMLNPELWNTAALIVSALSFGMTILAIIGISEKDRPDNYANYRANPIKFKSCVEIIQHNRPIQMLIIAAATDKLGSLMVQGVTIYVFANLLLNNKLAGTASSLMMIPMVLVSLFGVGVARKLGLKRAFMIGTWLSLATLIVMYAVGPNPQAPMVFIVLIIIQKCTSGLANNSVIPMLADCADYEYYRSGNFVPAIIGTLFSFVDKIISSLSTLIIGITLSVVGVSNMVITPNTPIEGSFNSAIMFCFCAVPILGHICSIISMHFYHLDRERMEEVQIGIEKRKAAQG